MYKRIKNKNNDLLNLYFPDFSLSPPQGFYKWNSSFLLDWQFANINIHSQETELLLSNDNEWNSDKIVMIYWSTHHQRLV